MISHLDKFASVKLKVLSFFLIVLVVCIHAVNVDLIQKYNVSDLDFTFYIQEFIREGVSRVAVPLFFLISAFLFFRNLQGKTSEFIEKFRKRFITLVVPYLLWSAIVILAYFLIQTIPQSRPFFARTLISEYSFQKLIFTLFIDPIPYQLWFIRDLIVLILISPLIFILIRYIKFYMVLVCALLWVLEVNLVILSPMSLCFFIAGAYIALVHPLIINARNQSIGLPLTVIWFILLVFKTMYFNSMMDFQGALIFSKICILFGLITVWFLYDYIVKDRDITQKKYYSLFAYSFFLFAFHEPFSTIVKKTLLRLMGDSPLHVLVSYFATILIVILVSLLAGYSVKRLVPGVYRVLTGGR